MHDDRGEGGAGLPEVGANGFIELTTLRRLALKVELDAFVRIYPVPGLVIEAGGEAGQGGGHVRAAGGLLTQSLPSVDILRYLGRVGMLAKRPGNAFSHMIGLGRTGTNDLVLDVGSVSKFHGFFQHQEGIWSFTDHRSTNGTQHNDQALTPGEKITLHSGDQLQFGLDVVTRFLSPEDLYVRVKQ